jgi:DNA-binding LacI/PurR family transcriptional regulator
MRGAERAQPARAAEPPSSTIFRVAREAGVSITTVSHVFSGKRHVSEATRARVLEVAESLEYQPRASARALATRRSMTVALQHSISGPEDMVNPFMGSMLAAMSEVAMRAGYSFLFVPPGATAEIFVAPLIDERRIDGAILVDPTPEDPFVSALMENGMPLVSLGRIEGHDELLRVDHDHAGYCRAVLEHLRSRGYQRPALMSLVPRMSLLTDIVTTFRSAAGSRAPIVSLDEFSEQRAYDAALQLLQRKRPPDAIYCINDLMAMGVARAARDLARRVPQDLGIVGVGDSVLARTMSVPLTSVRVYPEQAGTMLFEVLIDLMERGMETVSQPPLLPAELVVRESTSRA